MTFRAKISMYVAYFETFGSGSFGGPAGRPEPRGALHDEVVLNLILPNRVFKN